MTKLNRKERAKLIAQERALFDGMKITVRPDVARCEAIEREFDEGMCQGGDAYTDVMYGGSPDY